MGTYHPIAVLLAISFALSGCMALPWKSEEPRVAEQELKLFTIGVSTREDVQAVLGIPDLVRRDSQLWIYAWKQGHGKFVGLAPVQLFAVVPFQTPLYNSYHVLFIEFDSAGVLHDIDLVEGEYACSKDDVCVKHWDKPFNSGGVGPVGSYTGGITKEAGIYCPNADLGHDDAQAYIGDLYYLGAYSLDKNLTQAYVWYSLAAKKGNSYATQQARKLESDLSPSQLIEANYQLKHWEPGHCRNDLLDAASVIQD